MEKNLVLDSAIATLRAICDGNRHSFIDRNEARELLDALNIAPPRRTFLAWLCEKLAS